MRRIAGPVLSWAFFVSLTGCDPKTGEDPQMTDKQPDSSMLTPMAAEPEADGATEPAPAEQPPAIDSAEPLPPSQYSPPSRPQTRVHVVQPKDTLYSIARRYYSDQRQWRRILQANRNRIKDPDQIEVGMKLIIP